MRRNTPAGWAGFIALRCKPETKPKRHGNTKHGQRPRAVREAMAEIRARVRVIKDRKSLLMNFRDAPCPEGWRGFLRARAEREKRISP